MMGESPVAGRVALVHDWLKQVRGGERVLMELAGLFPSAPVYTSVYDPKRLPAEIRAWDVRTSFLQRSALARWKYQAFLPLMPLAFEQLDLSDFQLVISSSSACAKGVIPAPDAVHICYCHTPCRYIWDRYHEYTAGLPFSGLAAPFAHWLRLWDVASSARVDHFVANSNWVASRIRTYYRREADVVYPPVDVERIRPNGRDPEDFYLVVSALVGYKRIDLAVEAANRLGRRLIVVGEGPQLERLKGMGGATVEFRGRASDDEIADLMARCRAFVFPGLEDFGIAPVEAQAAGRPVIAYGRGGACETVEDGVTGLLFPEQTVDALADAMVAFEARTFDPALCRRNAERFGADVFRRRFMQIVAERAQASRPLGAPRIVAQQASNS